MFAVTVTVLFTIGNISMPTVHAAEIDSIYNRTNAIDDSIDSLTEGKICFDENNNTLISPESTLNKTDDDFSKKSQSQRSDDDDLSKETHNQRADDDKLSGKDLKENEVLFDEALNEFDEELLDVDKPADLEEIDESNSSFLHIEIYQDIEMYDANGHRYLESMLTFDTNLGYFETTTEYLIDKALSDFSNADILKECIYQKDSLPEICPNDLSIRIELNIDGDVESVNIFYEQDKE